MVAMNVLLLKPGRKLKHLLSPVKKNLVFLKCCEGTSRINVVILSQKFLPQCKYSIAYIESTRCIGFWTILYRDMGETVRGLAFNAT